MPVRRALFALPAVVLVAAGFAVPVGGDEPRRSPEPPPAAPWFVDDEQLLERFTERLGELADKSLPPEKLKPLVAADRTCTVRPASPSDRKLDPEDVYAAALPGVLLFGSVVPDEDGEYTDGRMATAWVLAPDGVVVTNWHVLDNVEDGERFGAMTRDGKVYPLTDVLAVNKAADVAVVRVAATGLTPLPVARTPARVGAWVGVLGHPGDRYYTFTQGHVSRYTKQTREDKTVEKWLTLTAEYAYGSSGSPVLDRTGAVVGMAALTEALDYPDDSPPAAAVNAQPPAMGPQPAPVARGSTLQMVLKLATPASAIRSAVGAE
ncbi:MAG: serine protease [Gemmataceae bacterium]